MEANIADKAKLQKGFSSTYKRLVTSVIKSCKSMTQILQYQIRRFFCKVLDPNKTYEVLRYLILSYAM